jgi:amino-acid N-acetyltransferase
MHNIAAALAPGSARTVRPRLSATHAIRPAIAADVEAIAVLVNSFVADGFTLPRTVEQIELRLDNYVVAVDANGQISACAALEEYSPSLGEVSSVAVRPSEQGQGLGGAVVLAVERMAEVRGIPELFAISHAEGFFESLAYAKTALQRYPEKLARYAAMRRQGVTVREKTCYRKLLTMAAESIRGDA